MAIRTQTELMIRRVQFIRRTKEAATQAARSVNSRGYHTEYGNSWFNNRENDDANYLFKLIELFESKTRIPFPLKLHRALVMAEEDDYGHVFAWLEHGRAFKVFNRKVFIAEVLPKYIGLNYDSYLR